MTVITKGNNDLLNTADMREDLLSLRDKLRSGEISPSQVQLEMKIANAYLATLKFQLDHARMTGRLQSGSETVPEVTLGMPVITESKKKKALAPADTE